MYTFLFAVNIQDGSSPALLRATGEAVRRLASSHGAGVELEPACVLLPELKGGWVQLAPVCEQPPALLSSAVDGRHAVLVWGEVERRSDQSPAQAVSAVWLAGGVAAVRRLEGCFSAVLVDRAGRNVALVSDLMGRRSLRYAAHEGRLLVSPHDLVIAASGACPLTLDPVAAMSSVVFEWSLQGRSLFAPIQACRPTEYVRWADGRVQRTHAPQTDVHARFAANNRIACLEETDCAIEMMQEDARRFAAVPGTVAVDLTAGMDTRAVLSLLLSVTDPSRLQALTRGEAQSPEVRVARQLAAACGVPFVPSSPVLPTPQEFARHCDWLAFHMNGDTSAKRAIDAAPRYEARPVPHAVGASGAVFKGNYYEQVSLSREGTLSFDAAEQIMQRTLRRRCRILPWNDPSHVEGFLKMRLRQAIDAYATSASDGCDLLDLFYLYERVGVWGALCARLPWLRAQWSPFESARLVRRFFRFPPVLRNERPLHAALIRRYLPRGYWVRLNGQSAPALYGRNAFGRRLRALDSRLFLPRRARGSSGPARASTASRTVDQFRADAFAGSLQEVVRETLMAEGSISRMLFGPHGAARLVEEHAAGRRNALSVLSTLFILERWHRMVREASGTASAFTRTRGG